MTEEKEKEPVSASELARAIFATNTGCSCDSASLAKKLAMKYPDIFIELTAGNDYPAADYGDTVNWQTCDQIDSQIEFGNKKQAALMLSQQTNLSVKESKLKIEKRAIEIRNAANKNGKTEKPDASRKLELEEDG